MYYKCEKCNKLWYYPIKNCIFCKEKINRVIPKSFNVKALTEVNSPSFGHKKVPYYVLLLEDEFGKGSHRLGAAIALLKKRGYVKDIKAILASIGDTSIDYEAYQLTALGKNYIANTAASLTSFNNITNSNIAHQSQNVSQNIKIADQPKDIQEKYKELQEAVAKKDSSAMKKAFGYITDRSVDVAIAIATGALLQ